MMSHFFFFVNANFFFFKLLHSSLGWAFDTLASIKMGVLRSILWYVEPSLIIFIWSCQRESLASIKFPHHIMFWKMRAISVGYI